MILRRQHFHIASSTLINECSLLLSQEGRRRRRPPLISHESLSTVNRGPFPGIVHLWRRHQAGASHAVSNARFQIQSNENGRGNGLNFMRPSSSNYQQRRNERDTSLQNLSRQVAFLFSDLNLRNNEHARSILRDNRSLPLKDLLAIKSVKNHTRDVGDLSALVIHAINFFNENVSTSSLGQSVMQLHVEESDDGETVVRRSPPFCYVESVKKSQGKMMVVEGWPKDKKARLSNVRSLICNRDVGDIPMSYFRFDYDLGVLNIEFESGEGANCAWVNLKRAASHADVTHGINVRNLFSDRHSKSYQLQHGELTLVARSIDISVMEETSLLDPEAMTNTAVDTMVSDDKQSNPVSSQKYSTLDKPFDSTILDGVANGTPTLSQFTDAMNFLYQEHVSLPPLSPEWLRRRRRTKIVEDNKQLLMRRQYLCRQAACLVSSINASINQGKIRALRGKDGYALTDTLALAMLVYSETQPSLGGQSTDGRLSGDAVSPYEACLDVFEILRHLNLDIQPSHYAYAIRAACRESRWREAAKLFLGQIDGNDTDNPNLMATGGFTPIDATLAWEGLYAVAVDTKMAEEAGGGKVSQSPSKRVFETAMKMCMISPSGQKSYILAAGTALGRAGCWKDCLVFATQPNSISTYGPSIAAAAMLACIECSRYAEAIDAYDIFMSGNQSTASEWQWGGGDITAVKPLCRDIALRAMGGIKNGGVSQDAVFLFKEIIRESHPVSSNALIGLAHSMEFDGDWQSSVKFLKSFIDSVYHRESTTWQIVSELGKSINANDEEYINPREQHNLLANITASVMRVCNSMGQQGLAILLCSIADNSYTSQQKMKRHDWVKCSAVVKAAASQKIISENRDVLEAFIQSLYGLGCGDFADELSRELQNDSSMPRRVRQNESAHAESWISAFVAIDRVLKALNSIRSEGTNISAESRLLFERGLSRAMEHCIDSSQPAAALELFAHASAILVNKDESMTGKVRSFFKMESSYGERKDSDEMFQPENINLKNLSLSDPLLAAIVGAYIKLGQPQEARSAFNDGTLHLDDATFMTQSNNNALQAILDIDIDEGLRFLDAMDAKCVNPSTFSVVARRYAENGIWPEIGDIYNRARSAGCISEDLGLIAMQAVCESELTEGKILILRRIVDDISGLLLTKSNDWIKSRYWTIKKNVGFHYARLLMRWNDPVTSKKEELLFAVNEMRKCASEGIVVKNAPLMCIVSIAELYGTDGRINSSDMSERQRRSSVNLILEACEEARRSGFIKNHAFTAKACRSLRALNANKECVQIVSSLISEGSKCRHRIAMEEAIYAASEVRDHISMQLITDVFEKSGYDSSRLSI